MLLAVVVGFALSGRPPASQPPGPAGARPTAGPAAPADPPPPAGTPAAKAPSAAAAPQAAPSAAKAPEPPPANPADLPPDHPPISPDVGPQVTIQWLGHAAFYLHSPGGAAVVADPYDPRAAGLPAVETGAHLVTVSSPAPDHAHAASVHAFQGERLRVLRGEGARLKDLSVTPVPLGGGRFAYVYEAGGLRLAHLGDLRAPLTAEQAKAIGAVDVVMVPAGGDGLSPKAAVEAAKRLDPRLVLPMAYALPGQAAPGLRPVDDFVAASPWAVTEKDQDVMLVSRAELPAGTEIVLLKPPRH